jgi:hypothetical protein
LLAEIKGKRGKERRDRPLLQRRPVEIEGEVSAWRRRGSEGEEASHVINEVVLSLDAFRRHVWERR